METPNNFLLTGHCRKIFIKNYVGRTIIGAYPEERTSPQKVKIEMKAWINDEPTNDDLSKTVDYDKLLNAIDQGLKDGSYLLEELAEKIAQKSLLIEGVKAVSVSVEKMDLLPHGASVGVEIFRPNPIC